MTTLSKPCPFCGDRTDMEFTETEIRKYFTEYMNGGKAIQSVFPDMPANKREFLMTGMCQKCQDTIFHDDEEE